MKLESVRELKQNLAAKVVPDLYRMVRTSSTKTLGNHDQEAEIQQGFTFALGASQIKEDDFRLAVRVQDRAFLAANVIDLLTKLAHGEIDVQYVGPINSFTRLQQNNRRLWPLEIGSSVGHTNVTTGTLGFFATDKKGTRLGMVSNNHVLAAENRGTIGDAILQPGQADGGSLPNDVVANLTRFVPIGLNSNRVDAAFAILLPNSQQNRRNIGGNVTLSGNVALADVGDVVMKIGRTTGFTTGRVTAIELDRVVVRYNHLGLCSFDGQIEIEGTDNGPFSAGGDSGSLIVSCGGDSLGLLFAGSTIGGANGKGLTYANDISTVLDELDVMIDATF